MKKIRKNIKKEAKGNYSQDIREADKNSRMRNAKKFAEVEHNDKEDSLNKASDGSDKPVVVAANKFGGDKYSAAVHTHTGRNWGFESGFGNSDKKSLGKNKS